MKRKNLSAVKCCLWSLETDFKCLKGAKAACPWNALSDSQPQQPALYREREGMHGLIFKGFMGHEIILLVKS